MRRQEPNMEPTIRKLTMDEPAVFRICIQGALGDSWADYLGPRAISVEENEAGIAFWARNGFELLPHFGWMQKVI